MAGLGPDNPHDQADNTAPKTPGLFQKRDAPEFGASFQTLQRHSRVDGRDKPGHDGCGI